MWSTKDLIYLGAILIWATRRDNSVDSQSQAIREAKEIFNKVYEESND